ncbi:MAG: bifunctional phosphoglucose/phosphomannose isomerase [Anaerolineales bacterium]
MNLDDMEKFQSLDSNGMGARIDSLPDQLENAWAMGQDLPLPEAEGLASILIAGMGGSAIGADLLAAYSSAEAQLPIAVWRDYGLPGWVQGPDTLVVASSHSGNTEETLSVFESAIERGARVLAVTTGGELAHRAEEEGVPLWRFIHDGPPRAAVGYSFGLLLAALARLRILPDPASELASAVDEMRRQRGTLSSDVPITQNPAKRMAGQLIDRWPTIIGAEYLAPVARRWRTQIAELAKAVAQFETLPEADHNMIAGVEAPESLFGNTMVVFLTARGLHPRNRERTRLTRELLMVEGFNTDQIEGIGEGRLAQQWTALQFGDYVAYFLAMAYGIDPTPVAAIEAFKVRLDEG